MRKKIFMALLVLAVLTASYSLYERYQVENSNKELSLVYDYESLRELQEMEDSFSFSELKEKGITGIGIFEDTLDSLEESGLIRIIRGNELQRRDILSGIDPVFEEFDYSRDSAFIVVSDETIINRVEDNLEHWQNILDNQSVEAEIELNKTEIETEKEKGERLIVFFSHWEDDYLDLSLGFDNELIENIESAGLQVIPRPESRDWGPHLDSRFPEDKDFPFVIFSGNEVPGYPDRIEETAQFLQNNDIRLGMIESFIGNQRGVNSLGRLVNYNLVRVHSIQQREMEAYTPEKIMDRYLRSARERNVRLLYLKPFLEAKEDVGVKELNEQFLDELNTRLKNEGYNTGESLPFSFFQNSILSLILIALGGGVAGIWLLERILNRKIPDSLSWMIFILILTVSGIMYFLQQTMMLRKIIALSTALVFPSLAVIHGLLEDYGGDIWQRLGRVVALSLTGIILLSGSLSHLSFILNIDQFRGVKLAFILPIFIIGWYFWLKYYYQREDFVFWQSVKDFLEIPLKIKHLLLLTVAALIGLIYIIRTGNYSFLPLSDIESYVREILEDILYVRPRFKAFLIGHPFLIVALYWKSKKKNKWLLLFLAVLAGVGQITVTNTFAHLHIPLKISFLRAFNGYWLGLFLGIVILGAARFFLKLWKRKSGDNL